MLLTLNDIAEIKKEITTIESSMAIAADCIDRGMESLSHLTTVVLRGDCSPFYISATAAAPSEEEQKEAFKIAMEKLQAQKASE
jgi:hypothetical protein